MAHFKSHKKAHGFSGAFFILFLNEKAERQPPSGNARSPTAF